MPATFQMRLKILFYFESLDGIDENEIRTRFENTVYPAMEAALKKRRGPTTKISHFSRKLKISFHDGWFDVYPKLSFNLTSTAMPGQARAFLEVVLNDYVKAFKAGFPELIGRAHVRYRQSRILTDTLITT